MKLQSFLRVYFPFLASFLAGRLILQTDLVMVSTLGEAETAAFGIPMRIMILDMIAAFAIAPVASVFVASSKNDDERRHQISSILRTSLVLSLVLMVIGLFVYPILTRWITPQPTIAALALDAVFYLTLAIPPRMVQFAGSMALHGLGKGRAVVRITTLELFINLAFNFLFILSMKMGFKGCYLATLVCSLLGASVTIFSLRDYLSPKILFKLDPDWTLAFIGKARYEILRLAGERTLGLLMLLAFSSLGTSTAPRMAAFVVAMEILSLTGVPCIAAMRSVSVILAQQKNESAADPMRLIARISAGGATLFLAGGILMALMAGVIGKSIYHLTPDSLSWWIPFVLALAAALPLRWYTAVLRGSHLANKDFRRVSFADLASQWGILLPLAITGIVMDLPFLAWSGIFLGEVGVAILLQDPVSSFIPRLASKG